MSPKGRERAEKGKLEAPTTFDPFLRSRTKVVEICMYVFLEKATLPLFLYKEKQHTSCIICIINFDRWEKKWSNLFGFPISNFPLVGFSHCIIAIRFNFQFAQHHSSIPTFDRGNGMEKTKEERRHDRDRHLQTPFVMHIFCSNTACTLLLRHKATD